MIKVIYSWATSFFIKLLLPFMLLTNLSISVNCQEQTVIDSVQEKQIEYKNSVYQLGLTYFQKGEYKKALDTYQRALAISKSLDDQKMMAIIMQEISLTYRSIGAYEQALEKVQQAMAINKKIGNQSGIGYNLDNLGVIFRHKGDYSKALVYLKESLAIAKSEKEEEEISRRLMHIGHVYFRQKDYDSALTLYEEALLFFKKHQDKRWIANSSTNIGAAYSDKGSYEKALQYFNESLTLYKEIGDKNGVLSCLNNITLAYFKKGDYKPALEFNKRALILAKERAGSNKMFKALHFASLIHEKKGNYAKAEAYLNQADQIAHQTSSIIQKQNIAKVAKRVYRKQGKWEEYVKYADIYQATTDSLFNKNVTNAIQNFKVKYETDRKEKSIELLKKENQLKELQLKNNRYFSYLLIGIALISLLLLGVLYSFYQSIKKISQLEKEKREKAEIEKMQFERLVTLEKEQSQKLSKINKLRSNLFANISHEFRTPLSLIYTPLKQMKERNFEGDRQKYFDIMFKNADHLVHLVEQMFDLSKLNGSEIDLKQEEVEIVFFTKKTIAQFESTILQKGLSLQLNTPRTKALGRFDKKMITKVIDNLLSNAIKFSKPKGYIIVENHFSDHSWQLTIQDNGIGIHQEELQLVFNHYYREYVGKHAGSNSGLGLALAKQIVELHKGTIEVNSKKQEGTTFIVTIPCLKESIPAMADNEVETIHYTQKILNEKVSANKPLPLPSSKDKEHLSPLILVIEDNVDLNTIITDQLKKDYRIIQSYNGKEGLKQAEEQMPDFILCDLMMPTMDGFQFLEIAKQSSLIRHIPVIIISALQSNTANHQAWKSGILDFITKPIDFGILKFKINNILENKQQFQQQLRSSSLLHKIPATTESKEIHSFNINNDYFKNIPDADQDLIQRFHQFVMDNLSDSTITIDEVASKMFVSRRHLHKKVKSILGLPPAAYIRYARLQAARTLLQQENNNISEIASQVGIPNITYFSTVFKAEFGTSPKHFRMQRRQKTNS